MARKPVQLYEVGEKVLCFHGPVMYEAKILNVGRAVEGDKMSEFTYFVHYTGWKGTWDDWVDDDRLRKASSDNREIMKQQHQSQKQKQRAEAEAKKSASKRASIGGVPLKKSKAGSDFPSSVRGSEERGSSAMTPGPMPMRGVKRTRDELEKEESFYSKPAVRIPIPDALKRMLVDDWEFVTKDNALVPIPHMHPVSEILNDYLAAEGAKRRDGSIESDILEEVVQGVREYFDRALDRILLYDFEREQWAEIEAAINKAPNDAAAIRSTFIPGREGGEDIEFSTNLSGKQASEIYGAEHLARLFVNMPELIAQTNMDQQSVTRLRDELGSMAKWLARHVKKYFSASYIPTTDTSEPATAALKKSTMV